MDQVGSDRIVSWNRAIDQMGSDWMRKNLIRTDRAPSNRIRSRINLPTASDRTSPSPLEAYLLLTPPSVLCTALVRFELMQALVRIAVAQYIRPKHLADVSEAVRQLLCNDLLPNLPPEAHHKPDDFRRLRLYKEDVDQILRCVHAAFVT